MDLNDLKDLIEFLKNTDISEFSIESKGMKIKLKREHGTGQFEVRGAPIPTPERMMPQQLAPQPAEEETHGLITVTAPLVGTFYRASSPEAAPFAEVGDHVKKGQVICVIEAMKLMNEIEAEADGVIRKVLVENAHPVEYGEPLFLIEPV